MLFASGDFLLHPSFCSLGRLAFAFCLRVHSINHATLVFMFQLFLFSHGQAAAATSNYLMERINMQNNIMREVSV